MSKEGYFKEGQIWVSKEHPERDIKIIDTWNEFNENNDNSRCIYWGVHNDDAWEKFVCRKLKVNTIDEAILERNNGTYPYEYGGEKTFKSMKAYIKKWGLELLKK